MLARAALCLGLTACSVTLRAEVGYDRDGWRAGGALGFGFADHEARRAVLVSAGGRYQDGAVATASTRGVAPIGPLLATGQVEVGGGLTIAPALLAPVWHTTKQHADSSIFPDSDAHLRTVTDRSWLSVGVQPRASYRDGTWRPGIDLVIEADTLTGVEEP